MTLKTTAAAALVGLGLLAGASPLLAPRAVELHNTGTTSGWDYINREHSGTVDQVTNVKYKGDTAIKVTQTYDSGYTGRYHSEVVYNNGYHQGQTKFYGFAVRLSESWAFEEQSYNLAQFIADFTSTGCDDWMPSSMVWIVGNRLQTRVKTGSICDQHTTPYKDVATLQAGVWHRIVIQAHWAADNTGFYKLWFDGNKVVEQFNTPTTIAEDREFSFRVGLYANGWHDDKQGMVGSQGFRQIWYDQIGVGSTFADADPAQWS